MKPEIKPETESKIIREFLKWYHTTPAERLRIEGASNTELIKNYQEFKYKC